MHGDGQARQRVRGPAALIIADDLSGAADCAAAAGPDAVVLFEPRAEPAQPDGILAVDLDTREVSPAAARRRAQQAVTLLHGNRPAIVYQKIDSQLRGNWAHELAGIRDALAAGGDAVPLALLTPALPEKGRLVRGGRLLVDGVARGSITEMLAQAGLEAVTATPGELGKLLAAAPAPVIVCDATSRADLDAVAAAGLRLERPPFWVGSSGLMGSLARRLGWLDSPPRQPARRPAPARSGPLLIVVGSASPVSRRQLGRLCERPDVVCLTLPVAGGADFTAHAAELASAFADGRHVVVALAEGDTAETSSALAAALGAFVAPFVSRCGGLVLTGGETARAVLVRAGVTAIHLAGEIEPGVPFGTTEGRITRPVITKSGAFGTPDTLSNCLAALAGAARPAQGGVA